MDDFQLGLLILGGIAIVGGLGLLYVVLTQPQSSQPTQVSTNEESWEWTDYHGQRRTLTAHRRVESKENVLKL